MSKVILIVDDDIVQVRLLEETLKAQGFICHSVYDGESALDFLMDDKQPNIDLMILDLVMPNLDGMGVLNRLKSMNLDIPVIVQTAQGSIDTAVNAIKAGAIDFFVKPVSQERLQISIQNSFKLKVLVQEAQRSKHVRDGVLTFDDLIMSSAPMKRVIEMGQKAAATNIPVLIEGETGVGKELIARAIQGESQRQAKAFESLNCGAIAESLLESTLFGHEKGAFTGATAQHFGKFRVADKGTLFLDEIGELPMEAQVKLLRVLQEGEVHPLGSDTSHKVDVRFISATNRRLLELTKAGLFREDLYYRLNVFPIYVPPLRDRREEIPALVEHFIIKFAAEIGATGLKGIAPEALNMLMAYNWPGNIRQLENTIYRAVVMADDELLTPYEFPQLLKQKEGLESMRDHSRREDIQRQPISIDTPIEKVNDDLSILPDMTSYLNMIDDNGKLRTLEELEREIIEHAVDIHRGRMSRIARELGFGRSTLYRKFRNYGIGDVEERDEAV